MSYNRSMAKIDTMMRAVRKYAESINHPGVGRHHIAAVISDAAGNIISRGANSYTKTHPTQAEYAGRNGKDDAIYLHAEIAALVRCRKDPHTIYVARYNRQGEELLAKPCPICQMAMREAGVKKVVYTTSNGEIAEFEI